MKLPEKARTPEAALSAAAAQLEMLASSELMDVDMEVVLLQRATASRDHLQSLGYAVQWHEYAMEHSLCQEEIQDIEDWLLRVLA